MKWISVSCFESFFDFFQRHRNEGGLVELDETVGMKGGNEKNEKEDNIHWR